MRLTLEKKTYLGFTLALLALVAAGGAVTWTARQLAETQRLLAGTEQTVMDVKVWIALIAERRH